MARGKKKVAGSERVRLAMQLRKAGLTYEDIALQLGYRDRSSAWRAVDRTLHKLEVEDASELRKLELSRLDELFQEAYRMAMAGDLKAIREAVKISESRRKLLGIDAPASVKIIDEKKVEDGIRNQLGLLAGMVSRGEIGIPEEADETDETENQSR